MAVHLEKRTLDVLQLRINDIGTWLTIFSEQLEAQIPKAPVWSVETGGQGAFPKERAEPVEDTAARQNSFDEGSRTSLDGGFRDDHSEHGTDQSTAYGEELRHMADGIPPPSRGRVSREFQYRPRIVKPTMASVLIFAQTGKAFLLSIRDGKGIEVPACYTEQLLIAFNDCS